MSTLPANIRLVDTVPPGQVVTTAPINCYTALAIPAFRRAVDFLSSTLAAFPRSVRKNGEKRAPEETPHPLDVLLELQPNGYQNASVFWQTLYQHAAHMGNGYAEITRDPKTFRPTALNNLRPERVLPFRYDREDGRGLLQYYLIDRSRVLLSADVIHIARFSHDGMAGMDPIQLHEGTLRRGGLLDAYVTRYLERGSVIRGSIEIPVDADDDKVDAIVDRIRRYFRGVDAENDVIVLTDGTKLNNAGLSPEEGQLVQQYALTTKQIAQITGVDPYFLMDRSETKYADVEQAGQDVIRFTFLPWLEVSEDELTLKLLTPSERLSGLRVVLDPERLLRGNAKAQADIGLAELKSGAITANEYRRRKGLPPSTDPEADKLKMAGDTSQPKPPAAA